MRACLGVILFAILLLACGERRIAACDPASLHHASPRACPTLAGDRHVPSPNAVQAIADTAPMWRLQVQTGDAVASVSRFCRPASSSLGPSYQSSLRATPFQHLRALPLLI